MDSKKYFLFKKMVEILYTNNIKRNSVKIHRFRISIMYLWPKTYGGSIYHKLLKTAHFNCWKPHTFIMNEKYLTFAIIKEDMYFFRPPMNFSAPFSSLFVPVDHPTVLCNGGSWGHYFVGHYVHCNWIIASGICDQYHHNNMKFS